MKSNLLVVGRKFKVVDPSNDSTYGVGSTGYMSYLEKMDSSFMNLAQMRAVMTRRGKGGKERIEPMRIYIPIFPVPAENFHKAMPEKGMRKRYLHIEPDGSPVGDVMELKDVDYLGWAHAYVRRMRYMVEKCKHNNWPGDKNHLFNRLQRVHEYFESDPDRIKEMYAGEERRIEFLDALRPMMSSLVRINLKDSINRADILKTAAEFLEFTNSGEFIPKDAKDKKNEFRFTEDEKSLKLLVKKHKKMKDRLTKLSKAKAAKKS